MRLRKLLRLSTTIVKGSYPNSTSKVLKITPICYCIRSRTAEGTKQKQDHEESMDSIQYLGGRRILVRPF
jgi:hypothetical protein